MRRVLAVQGLLVVARSALKDQPAGKQKCLAWVREL